MLENKIDSTAKIAVGVKLGRNNVIKAGVVIEGFCGSYCDVEIGDCNEIHEGVRILVGPGKVRMGDWNKIHKDTTILGTNDFIIGHNVWIGQCSYFDCRGGIKVGNNVVFGYHSTVWSHVAAGELIEGCLLEAYNHTVIED